MNELLNNISSTVFSFITEVRERMRQRLDGTLLKDNIELSVEIQETNVIGKMIMPFYATFANFGRRPGKFPPAQPILNWIIRKGIERKALYPIRRKIATEGTIGRDFFRILPESQQELNQQVENTVNLAIQQRLSVHIENLNR